MGCVQVSLVKYRFGSDKNASYITSILDVYPVFVELLRVLPYRKSIVVKARDVCVYLGRCDHYTITSMGKLLSFLEKLGLAIKLNNSRPIHYVLDREMFSRIKMFCMIDRSEDYCVEHGCSLLGICPYWLIKQLKGDDRQ